MTGARRVRGHRTMARISKRNCGDPRATIATYRVQSGREREREEREGERGAGRQQGRERKEKREKGGGIGLVQGRTEVAFGPNA